MSAPARRHRSLATSCGLHFHDGGCLAEFESLLGRGGREQVHDPRDDAGPAGLMAGTDAGSIVAVEVLVEQYRIVPVRILLELPRSPVDRPSAFLVAQEDAGQPPRDFLGDL